MVTWSNLTLGAIAFPHAAPAFTAIAHLVHPDQPFPILLTRFTRLFLMPFDFMHPKQKEHYHDPKSHAARGPIRIL